jgi:glycine/D-amino acid oxidase-like deaminating enzyme
MDRSMNVIVVGAGIAGLSTAWSLVKAGHNVTLLERVRATSSARRSAVASPRPSAMAISSD